MKRLRFCLNRGFARLVGEEGNVLKSMRVSEDVDRSDVYGYNLDYRGKHRSPVRTKYHARADTQIVGALPVITRYFDEAIQAGLIVVWNGHVIGVPIVCFMRLPGLCSRSSRDW
jgi:hypothetical protein